MIKITIDEKYVIHKPVEGNADFNEAAFNYRSNLLAWGIVPKRKGTLLEAELINGVALDLTDFHFVMSLDNGEVIGFKPYVKIAEADINGEVSVGLPNRVYPAIPEYEDEEGVTIPEVPERVKTWNEWFLNYSRDGVQGNYTKTIVEGFHYYNINGCNKGKGLTGSELLLIPHALVLGVPVTE